MEKIIKTENIEYQQRLVRAIADMHSAATKEDLDTAYQMAESIIKMDKRKSVDFLTMERTRLENVTAERYGTLGAIRAARVKAIKEKNKAQWNSEMAERYHEVRKCCNAAWLAETLAVAKQRGIITDYSLTIPTAVEEGGSDE